MTLRLIELLIVPTLLVCGVVLAVAVVYRSHSWMDMAGHMTDPMQQVQAENESFRTLAQLFGGAFILAGLYFSGKTIVLSRLAQSSDRLGVALEGLGGDEPRRLGAIAVLGSFLDRSSAEYDTALSTLCAFVRSTTASEEYRTRWADRPSVEVQSAIEALSYRRRRSRRAGGRRELNLRGSYLAGCDFRDADLTGADFHQAILTTANFHRASLRDAKFTEVRGDNANFVQADLRKATFYRSAVPGSAYREAILNDAIFTRANLSKASFAGTVLRRVSFSSATLRAASFTRARLIRCDFANATTEDADFTDADRQHDRF